MNSSDHELQAIHVKLVVAYLNQLPDDERAQAKYLALTEIMQGEGGNFSANVWITLLADFAIATMNTGFDPKMTLLNIRREAQKLVEQKLKEQGITRTASKGTGLN